METVIVIVAIVFFVIYLFAQDSKKETTREKYGEAIGQVAHSAASTIAGIAHDIAEPASKKEIRLAREALAFRNGQLYRYEYYSEKEMETNFAIAIKGFFSEGIDYSGLEKIEGVVKLSDVNEIMKLHIGESYYSIMNPQKLKINLEEKGSNKYNIYLLGPNGECEYIEENEEAPFVFERFYNEAVYLKVILERVRGYEAIFEETLSEKEIYDIIK